MSPETFVLLSGALTYGVPIALGVRELVLLRRDPAAPATDPVPPAGGGAPARPLPPLPDCLIPRPLEGAAPASGRTKERILEPA
jgi:hypothetical protein